MDHTDQINLLLSTFAAQVPVLIVSLVACAVILAKWKEGSRGSLWALLAFGLTLILCLVIPIVQTTAQSWAIQSGVAVTAGASVFTGLAVFWSVLRGITYVLLLVAVYAGRAQ